jgi:hypothetical protein
MVERERDEAILKRQLTDTLLISCPWCFATMEKDASLTIKHLIGCGDRAQEEIRHSRDRLREALRGTLQKWESMNFGYLPQEFEQAQQALKEG